MGGGEAGSEAPQVCRGKEEKGEEESVEGKNLWGFWGSAPPQAPEKGPRE